MTHILLVEDHADLADAIATLLRRRRFTVTHAGTGERALQLLDTTAFKLIILDLMLPGVLGPAVLKSIRAARIAVPVLVMTARAEIDAKISLLDLGADDYLVKPFDLRELEARARALLRRPAGASASLLQIGALTVDDAGRTASVADVPVDLSPREFRLLVLLAGQRGRVIAKERLIDQLFASEADGSANAVELYASRLRKKLAHADVEIVTVRGDGYLLRQRVERAR